MMLVGLWAAVLAGALSTLAPCVLPLLPVIVGGSWAGDGLGAHGLRRALLVTTSLGVSIVAFTLLIKVSTLVIGVPHRFWPMVSGGLLILLGLGGLFPQAWEWLSARLLWQQRATDRLAAARGRDGVAGALLTGAALGPAFSSCSPLYAYLVVMVLPVRLGYGLALLVAYAVGLCLTLLAVTLAGRGLIRRLGWAADSHGLFRRGLGLLIAVVGLAVLFGWDLTVQAWAVRHSPIAAWTWEIRLNP